MCLGNISKYNMDKVKTIPESILKDKKILFLGSSVTKGYASFGQGIPEYVRKRFSSIVTKDAVNGTTLVNIGDNNYIERLIKHTKEEAYDLVVVQLSTNDARLKYPLGSIDDSDQTTITGSINFIAYYVKKTWECPIIFYTNSYYENKEYELMVERINEIKDIFVIDLYNNKEFNNISKLKRSLYMADTIHPTKAGYKNWWCPQIEKELLNILNGG